MTSALSIQDQLYPLELNPSTGEPFLRLPPPHQDIIITPARMSDVQDEIENMSDPGVYKWCMTVARPYTEEHARNFLGRAVEESNKLLDELKGGEDRKKVVGGCPVRALREVKADGSEIFVGDIGVFRSRFAECKDKEKKERLAKGNAERKVGDEEIVWGIGGKGDLYMPHTKPSGVLTLSSRRLGKNLTPGQGHHDSCGAHHPEQVDDPADARASRPRRDVHRQHREHACVREERVRVDGDRRG